MNKKNVVIIMADQLRFDALGIGYTPNIDALRDEGVTLENLYCGCPLCVPARGAFFTGTYPNVNGSVLNPWEKKDAVHGDVKEEFETLYELMENDWDSIHTGKQHLYKAPVKLENRPDSKTKWASTDKSYQKYLKENNVTAPGTDGYFKTPVPETVGGKYTRISSYSNANTARYEQGADFYFDRFFAKKGVEALKNRDRSKPLLLNAMFLAPHPPFEIPDPWYSRVPADGFTMPENVGEWYEYQSPMQMYNLTGVVGGRYTKEQWHESWRVYLGLVSMLDDCVGELVQELKAQGIYDDTLIVFTADHGEMLGSHRLFQKMCMYEPSAHVPMYIKFPAGTPVAERTITQVLSHIDFMPTLCDYLEIAPRHTMNGKSFLPLIMGTEQQSAGEAYIQFDGNGSLSNFQRCLVRGEYKLIADIFKDEIYYELYNVQKDPQETENLLFVSKEYDAVAEEMTRDLIRHMEETNDTQTIPAPDFDAFREAYMAIPAKRSVAQKKMDMLS